MLFDDSHFKIRISHHISDFDPNEWDGLSGERPFQSYSWYQYGEQVMSDCLPTYILLYHEDKLIARASLWLIRNEPLPLPPGVMRRIAQYVLNRWPLLICRSPLSSLSGLILSDKEDKKKMLLVISETAFSIAKKQNASLLLFDFLSKAESYDWPHPFAVTSIPDPGTVMESQWGNMDEYLASGNKKNRNNYNRVAREAEKLGIKITRHTHFEQINDALNLIHNVEQKHGGLPNPWARAMIEHMTMVNGIFLTAALEEKIVGCGIVLEDNKTQTITLLGLAENTPFVYFMILYETLKIAFEHKVGLLRWGSGAYDVKQRLGFSLEDNDTIAIAAINPFFQKALQWSK